MAWRTVGFEKQKRSFLNLIKNQALSHAYIFEGPDQIGKKLFAQDLFTLINARSKFDDGDPDLLTVAPKTEEGETKIYVEDIRDLKNFLSLKPFYGPYQAVIIDDAHRLTPEASNAFLKILEEPTGKVIFFLITSQPRELLSTISSRAQHVSFLPHDEKIISEALVRSGVSKSDQELAASVARGRLGWIQSISEGENLKNIKQAIVDFKNILKSPLAERMLYAKNIIEKQPYREEVSHWLSWVYVNRADLPDSPRILNELLKLHQYINQPQYNHRLLLENTLINL